MSYTRKKTHKDKAEALVPAIVTVPDPLFVVVISVPAASVTVLP